jgi:hypothetical protein
MAFLRWSLCSNFQLFCKHLDFFCTIHVMKLSIYRAYYVPLAVLLLIFKFDILSSNKRPCVYCPYELHYHLHHTVLFYFIFLDGDTSPPTVGSIPSERATVKDIGEPDMISYAAPDQKEAASDKAASEVGSTKSPPKSLVSESVLEDRLSEEVKIRSPSLAGKSQVSFKEDEVKETTPPPEEKSEVVRGTTCIVLDRCWYILQAN